MALRNGLGCRKEEVIDKSQPTIAQPKNLFPSLILAESCSVEELLSCLGQPNSCTNFR